MQDSPAATDEEWDDDGYDPDYYEIDFPSDLQRRAFCDVYEVHAAHNYRAINTNHYDCPGLTHGDLAECERIANLPPCEHGLSADLCAGPNHYPADNTW